MDKRGGARSGALAAYANTIVPVHKTREGIEGMLRQVGARGFAWRSFPGEETLEAALTWKGRELAFRIVVSYKPGDDKRQRQLMRALYWYVKTKVEAVQIGLVDLEHEFLPQLLTQSGRTVFEIVNESLDQVLADGHLMLAAPKETR